MEDILETLIPIMIFAIPLLAIWTKHQQKMMEVQAKISAEKAAQYANNNSDLEDRVRVLERIITDRGYDVSAQIEALRDQRRVDELIETNRQKEASQ